MRLDKEFKKSGAKEEGSVPVDISYDIIRQFSAQLYTSPRKAIEELVCNSYDAGASECYVGLPQTTKEPLLVLDNGKSMNLEGIRGLWQVAKSPKIENSAGQRIANGRMQIGKFGVGKLAAFALGERLTHIACVKGDVRIISVGQDEIKEKTGGKAPTFKVHHLPLAKAKPLMMSLFDNLPKPWEKSWGTWTIAMVEEISANDVKEALKVGFLRRMIMTALPVSAKFKVFLEKELVPKRIIPDDKIEVRVDVTDEKFRKELTDALLEYWAQKLNEAPESVPKSKYTLLVEQKPKTDDTSKTVKALIVPILGTVIGGAISTKTSLETEKLQERGYSDNGFAVTAFGKLVNPEDPLFGITQRSHRYWIRFLATLEIPSLDKVLLVQRNAVSENSPEAEIAREVLRTLFNYTRSSAEKLEEKGEHDPGSLGHRLESSSPILAQAALRGLIKGKIAHDDLEKLTIDFGTFGAAGPFTKFDEDTRTIVVNQEHPLIIAMDDLGTKSKQMRRVIGEVLAGIEIGKGYLNARNVREDIIVDTGELIDASLRSAAEFVCDPLEEHIREIEDASLIGGKPFEIAVVQAFRSLRLVAHDYGKVDEPDGIIEIPRSGKENLRISVEAKGSKGVITHTELSTATVERHSGEHACQHAVAVAREFATEGITGKESALLRETKGKVPLLTVEGIEKMLRLHKRRNFTYAKVEAILTTWKHPEELVAFIEETWREMPELGRMRLILKVAHELMSADSINLPDSGMIIGDSRIREKHISREEVRIVLECVAITTGMITIVNRNDYQFILDAHVDTVLEAMQAQYEKDKDLAAI